jgi:hypothetical protein
LEFDSKYLNSNQRRFTIQSKFLEFKGRFKSF